MAHYETFKLNATVPLETYEWDDIWFDHATDTQLKRILVFGDSISVNYRFTLVEELRGKICVDNYVTIHAASSGAKTIHLPQKATVTEVYDGTVVASNADTFTVEMLRGETKMFRLTE